MAHVPIMWASIPAARDSVAASVAVHATASKGGAGMSQWQLYIRSADQWLTCTPWMAVCYLSQGSAVRLIGGDE